MFSNNRAYNPTSTVNKRVPSTIVSGTHLKSPILSRKDLMIEGLIKGCLKESGFSEEDSKYVSRLAYGFNWNQDEPPTPAKGSVSNWMTRLAFVLVHTWRNTTSGKFSLTYNLDLGSSIRRKNIKRIESLWMSTGPENIFPEIYENIMLSRLEKNSIQNIYIKEYTTVINALRKMMDDKNPDFKTLFSEFKKSYNECYQRLTDNYNLSIECGRKAHGNSQHTPSSLQRLDPLKTENIIFVPNGNVAKNGSLIINETKAYDFMNLMTILAEHKISMQKSKIGNAGTFSHGRPFDNLLKRYHKEISMVIIYLGKKKNIANK